MATMRLSLGAVPSPPGGLDDMLARVRVIGDLAPELVESMLRPWVAILDSMVRTCANEDCRTVFVAKSQASRPRSYCGDDCRAAANRRARQNSNHLRTRPA